VNVERLFDVDDRVALITGAASGLGFAMAEVLGINGAQLIMVDKDAAMLAGASERLRGAGVRCDAIVLDVTDAAAVKLEIAGALERHRRLDIAILNAGISLGQGFDTVAGQIENVPLEIWEKLLDVNLTGAFLTLRAVAPIMKQAALELAPFGVLVNGIAPGPFATQIGGGRINSPDAKAKFAAMSPLRRVANADEIKGVTLLLASGACSFMTGAVLPVDGGMCAQ
jgi:NAD(P)-dependent dehydrogenase (short-subunit alcohol dehydrogenase family)